jgi:hypothetical protein
MLLSLQRTCLNSLLGFVDNLATGENSMSNVNIQKPKDTIYPKKGNDPKYSVTESSLRAAIYIPPSFQGGEVQPVILMPGTGSTGYLTYAGNCKRTLKIVVWHEIMLLTRF